MCQLPALWTHDETAAYLRIDPDLLHQLVTVGRGPSGYWVGRHRRYDSEQVQAWLMSQRQPRRPDRPPRHVGIPPAPALLPAVSSAGLPGGAW